MSISEKLRIFIKNNELNINSIAQKAGISHATINAILNGKQTLYSDEFRALCYALNVKPEKFI